METKIIINNNGEFTLKHLFWIFLIFGLGAFLLSIILKNEVVLGISLAFLIAFFILLFHFDTVDN